MKRELGIARCGLACCLCAENAQCAGSHECSGKEWCVNRKCSMEKGLRHCCECASPCEEGVLGKIKPRAFNEFIRRYGEEALLDCLERNEQNGVVYHRQGIVGDYDDFDDMESLIEFIKNGGVRQRDMQADGA